VPGVLAGYKVRIRAVPEALAGGDARQSHARTRILPEPIADASFRKKETFVSLLNFDKRTRMAVNLLYTYGVKTGRLDLHTFVEIASTNAARIFSLFPRKGTIQSGSDADLVIYDPSYRGKLSAATHLMNIDYNAFEGWPIERQAVSCHRARRSGCARRKIRRHGRRRSVPATARLLIVVTADKRKTWSGDGNAQHRVKNADLDIAACVALSVLI
jgi:Amidohydrolase family